MAKILKFIYMFKKNATFIENQMSILIGNNICEIPPILGADYVRYMSK